MTNLIVSFLLVVLGITLNLNGGSGVAATKILLRTRPNTYFHLPIEFSSPGVKNGPSFVKFSNGHLVGVANDSNGVYNFELFEDDSVVEVELVVQKENGLCYDPKQQIFSKALTLDEKLSIAKQTEIEIRINGKNRGLEFIDGLDGHFGNPQIKTTLRYQIPCQDYYATLNSHSENDIESSIVDIRSRPKRQNKHNHNHNDHLTIASGDGDGDIDENEEDYDEDEDEDDEEIEERIIPSVPTPTFEMPSIKSTAASDDENFIEQFSSTFTDILPVPTPSVSSSISRTASFQPIQATPAFNHPHEDLLSSSAIMFENLSDAGSGDFEIRPPIMLGGHYHSTTSRPTPVPEDLTPDHDHVENIVVVEPTSSSHSEHTFPTGPILRRKIEKILIPAGITKRFDIANNIFSSENNLIYQLESENGTIISRDVDSTSWIKFIDDTTIIFAPTMEHVSEYSYQLIAIDEKTRARATTEVLISVRQRQRTRMYNHEFELTYTKLVDGEISDLIGKIVNYTRGNNAANDEEDFILTKMETEANVYKIKWTNESLLIGHNSGSCPKEDLTAIFHRLSNSEGEPTPQFRAFMHPNHTPTELKIILKVPPLQCAGVKPEEITNSTRTAHKPIIPTENFPPSIMNHVDRLDVVEGEYLTRKVEGDFCYDPEDIDTKKLSLKLMHDNLIDVNETNWLQFDKKNQELYGLPMGGTGTKRKESYILSCTDSGGKSANDALVVEIGAQQKTTYSAEFSLHFQSVPFTPQNLRKFLNKLSTAFNDSISNIVVKDFQETVTLNNSMVHFRWFNKSDPSTEFELFELGRVLLSETGPPNKRVVEIFTPEFNLSGGQVIPNGKLLGSGTHHHFDMGNTGKNSEGVGSGGDGITIDREDPDGAYLVTYIIPSVLIFVMILLASLIACLLSRKRKAVPTASEEETKRFIKKGVPVIFQDELEDASYSSGRGGVPDLGSGSRSRSPAILREERPPLPPSYNRRSPPNIDYRNSASNQPSYQPPPPPVARAILPSATRGMRPGGGSAAANYRKPPPYVPP